MQTPNPKPRNPIRIRESFDSSALRAHLDFDKALAFDVGGHHDLVDHAGLRVAQRAGHVLLDEALGHVGRLLRQRRRLRQQQHM